MRHPRFFIFLALSIIISNIYAETSDNYPSHSHEYMTQNNSETRLHGRLVNQSQEPLQGAYVGFSETRFQVNTNENGEFLLTGLSTGIVSLTASHLGYKTSSLEITLNEGRNEIVITLEEEAMALEAVTVTSQQRGQQLLNIPATITTLSGELMESANIKDMEHLSDFVPGMNARIQTPHRPSFVIRGLTSDEVSPNAQPRISVYYNQVPVCRASMALSELYDMERVEVLKGPQGTLFGRGSQIGAISFMTRKPQQDFGGYITTGTGNYGHKELQGAINAPIIDNKLLLRVSGIYSQRDGYVENTYGGTLNGKNTSGGRLSLSYMPFHHTKADLTINYQKDDHPGTAFMSKRFPNSEGETDIFKYRASLEQGEDLYNKREVLGSSLNVRHYRTENNYWTSLTSLYTNSADSRWDGDGTHAPAIDMAEGVNVDQFTQEIRYNFSRKSHTNGFFGASYWRENVKQTYWFNPNEQHMAYLFLQMPEYLIAPDGNAYPMTALPDNPALGPLAGMPLPTHHEEENRSSAFNQAMDVFADATWNMSPKLSFTAGIRATYERFKVGNESMMTGGSPSVLGMLAGNQPNLFFRPVDLVEVEDDFLSYTWRTSLKYDFNRNSGIFGGYSKGRRPNVIQFNSAGEHETMNQEIVHSFETGFKWVKNQRYWFDIAMFYQLYKNFQTTAWDDMSLNYLIRDAGKATSFGTEASVKAELHQNISLFGNYAWIHARFDEKDSDGNDQEYSGNAFRLTPEHSFALGIDASIDISSGLKAFFVPTYGWKSHIWFEDANTEGLEQDAYGLLHARMGLLIKNYGITIAVTGHNILNEKYIISAGNTGTMFGVPTFVPGAPRMTGIQLNWKF
jgi:iron complex outermembrane recepter protein